MISYLQGIVHHQHGQRVVLLVQDVGYEIEFPKRLADQIRLKETLSVWVHQIVREDANDLYGFSTYEDREAYRLILKAPQVGPKVALAILDVFSLAELANIGFNGTAEALLQVKGLGKKLAERLLIDLKSWVSKGLLGAYDSSLPHPMASTAQSDALQALIQLGYKESQVRKVLHDQMDGLSSQELIRQALQMLSSRGVSG